MLPKPEPACFVIADISGYTSFLAAAELDHAQDIIADFMETVVKALRPPFKLAKFEGDAAFLYAPGGKIDGSALQDAIEQAYGKFRRRQRDVKQASSCTCKACVQMGDLDFKFVVHHGEMVKQKMGGREELVGRDVILVHRLLKNSAGEKLGGHAYILYSDACVEAMGIDPLAQGLIEHGETIDVIGEVKLWLRDLEAAWQEEDSRKRLEVTHVDAYLTLDFDFAALRETVWQYLTVPGQWQSWWPADAIVEKSNKGRRGIGTVNHCMHGEHAIIEEVVDWHPPDYFTISILLPAPGAPKIVMTRALETLPGGGTRLAMRVAKPKPKDKDFVDQAAAAFAEKMKTAIEKLRAILKEQQIPLAAIDEPPLNASNRRFLTEPVTLNAVR